MCPFLFSIILLINRCNCRRMAVCVLCIFLVVKWVGLQSVIVAFSGHTLLLLKKINSPVSWLVIVRLSVLGIRICCLRMNLLFC